MNNLHFTFLTKDQVEGKNQLDVLKKYGTKCAITDFSLLLGGRASNFSFTKEGNQIKDKASQWWTRTKDTGDEVFIVDFDGEIDWANIKHRQIGARPAISYSEIEPYISNIKIRIDGVNEVEYGEYPQTVENDGLSQELEIAFLNNTLQETSKKYTTDSVGYNNYNTSFSKKSFDEYEYKGDKYIRFVADTNSCNVVLSNGKSVEIGKPYWIRVEPITWLVDEITHLALAKKILFSGVQFKYNGYYDNNFNNTNIKYFMDNIFSKEIISQLRNTKMRGLENSSLRKNPYNFNFCKVSEEDIIRGAVESNISVFLHGLSGDGKSARVKQLDPNCKIIYLSHQTLDSFCGKSVYDPSIGKMKKIPPTWYEKFKEKCEKEPNKIHIVFFDELTNASNSIQDLIFNLVLDGELDGTWKLPDNARIIAAGNEEEESLSAYEMSEPLFSRFAHVYISTPVNKWLDWALTPPKTYQRLDYKKPEPIPKIHPAIYSYIAYKAYKGKDVLRTPYNGKTPNANPRKWEMASKMLYQTDNPEMLRSLIGVELTKDFISFVKRQVVTVDDVINNNYDDSVFSMDASQQYSTAVGLSLVDDEYFDIVRSFMKKISEEACRAFESMWARDNVNRLLKIEELHRADELLERDNVLCLKKIN